MAYSFEDHLRFMAGMEPVITEGPFNLFQRDRFLGTVPQYPVRSTSGIFDVRPGDFTLTEKDGERVINVTGMIGPGDIACVAGFIPASHLPADFMNREMADAFDAMTAIGASRVAAIGNIIEDALSNPKGK